MNKTIYVVINSEFISQAAYWERMTVEAIQRRGVYRRVQISIIQRDSLCRLPRSAGPVLVIAASLSWLMETLTMLQEQGLSCIVVGSCMENAYDGVSVIRLNQIEMAEYAARYLHATHHERLAFLAYNMRSMNDKGKVEGLKRVCRSLGMPFDDNDIFLFNGDVMECVDRFVERCDEYDAVICANDVSGLQLLRSPKLLARKRIPEDLYVISYGNTLLSRLCQPSLTTISLDYRQVGSIAVDNALYLRKNPDISCQHTTVRSKITLGASTNYEEVSLRGADMTPRFEVDTSVPSADDYIAFYKDATASRVLLVEGLLNELDKLSLYILLMLLRGYHKSRLMDALYISESTYKYRLRKICAAAGVKTRGELMELVGEWIDPAKLDEHLASLSMVNEDN